MKDKGHEDHEIHDKINEFHETSPEEVKVRLPLFLIREIYSSES